MPDPISELIRKNRLAALEGIKVANGYSFDAIVEANDPIRGNGSTHGTIVLGQGKKEPAGGLTGDGGFQQWRRHFVAQVFFMQSKDDERDVDELLNYVEADVEKALMSDNQCGGVADLTDLEGTDPFVEVDEATGQIGRTGFYLRFSVLYYNREANQESRD